MLRVLSRSGRSLSIQIGVIGGTRPLPCTIVARIWFEPPVPITLRLDTFGSPAATLDSMTAS
eukprot:4451740-Prymnesium_polylepis.1